MISNVGFQLPMQLYNHITHLLASKSHKSFFLNLDLRKPRLGKLPKSLESTLTFKAQITLRNSSQSIDIHIISLPCVLGSPRTPNLKARA